MTPGSTTRIERRFRSHVEPRRLRRGFFFAKIVVAVERRRAARGPRLNEELLVAENYSRRCWFTFPTRTQVEQPIIWQMSRKFPELVFDIRQASVQHEIGIMAVLLSGNEPEVNGAIEFLRSKGVTVEPIEKSVVEG